MTDDEFKVGDRVVYPSHKSIGIIVSIEQEEIAGTQVSLYKIKLEEENMILRVPVNAAVSSGLRCLGSKEYIDNNVIAVLRDVCGHKGENWRNCLGEYENKLNSGDLMLIAEVVRDLFTDGDMSYSKRNLYDAALNRLASEVSSVYSISNEDAKSHLIMIRRGLSKRIVRDERKKELQDDDVRDVKETV